MECAPGHHVAFQLPASVTDLKLTVHRCVENAVDALTRATSIRRLNLRFIEGPMFPDFLTRMQLVTLTIDSQVTVTDDHLRVIKQLSTLRSLTLFDQDWTLQKLQLLCTPPHAFHQLEHIGMVRTSLAGGHMEALHNIPSLTELCPSDMIPTALHVMHRCLPRSCTKLHISMVWRALNPFGIMGDVDLSRITALRLEAITLSSDVGVRFMCTRLPSVTDLQLSYCDLPSDLSQLAMPQLHTLSIHNLQTKRVTRSQLTNLPALQSFEFTAPF